ncbi:UDP-N-acetylmuramate--L-alanine ligase, partial [Candidatus Parcubacteria bacterium]|nr:UDP-N-acetylmuramate--L-alanine ligase [Candidatus Parcubacteria bacterium]
FPDKKIIAVFQPHLYSRTKTQLNEFAESFKDADDVLLAPIFAAREKPDPSITPDMLAAKIGPKAHVLKSFHDIENYLKSHTTKNSLVITIGAGDIYKVAENLVQ